MNSKLLQGMIGIVFGLVLLPVVNSFATDLTTSGGQLENSPVAPLVDLLPIVFVIAIVAGAIAYVSFSKKNA